MYFKEWLRKEISTLKEKRLKRSLREIEGPQGARVVIEGREVVNLCSNDYLGLASDPILVEAACKCMQHKGLGSGASRLICGNMDILCRLEHDIAVFKGCESSIVFSTGYMANVGIISSLFNREDIIFSDRLNHASIIDGIILSRARFRRYPHNDMSTLTKMLASSSSRGKRCIVTDSIFSMDGDIAPLDDIVEIARQYNCIVMIDEAHAFGVIGEKGRGLAEYFNVEDEVDIQMGTLSKAVGSFGAYCCGSQELISFLVNRARSFIYTTAMPAAVAAASRKAVQIISEDSERRNTLWSNTRYMREGLLEMGLDIMNSSTPIIPILVKDSALAVEFSYRLFDKGVLITAIRPPTVPLNTARLRLTVTAVHTKDDLAYALNMIKKVALELGII